MELITFSLNSLEKMLLLSFISFVLAIAWTPLLTNLLYKYKLGKQAKKENAPVFNSLNKDKMNTPTMGGLLIWVTTAIVTLIFNLSREATWLPLFTLVVTGILGLADDLANVLGKKGIRARYKLFWQFIIAAVGAWWFYVKLEWGAKGIHIPGFGDFSIGFWFIPLFIFVIVATINAVNITDGLDGLAGGLLMLSFFAYALIALVHGQTGIAIFCASITGALLAFLWFNIYPARFIMGDTGSTALGATLGVIAMLTNSVAILPIIGFVFVFETLSVIIQFFWKKFFGHKLFLSSPIHHHLEAYGWPEPKVVMRLWVLGAIFTVVGLIMALFGRG
ncbi:MAG: phospho-N-acetylmuramoyl-pentapeptide-transferase [Candidatus Berkelbacteria bacterium]|nr:phospho-N-acetylmuramoyl-pentapeptide-transferase [Candidatus Berkelbacteria bacterium]